jgi:hypothetical protein
MVNATQAFTQFLFNKDLFIDYGKYHSLLMDFSNSLITKDPDLPNNAIPQGNNFAPTEDNSLVELLKGNGKSWIEGVVILGSIIAISVLAGLKVLPWVIPVVWTVVGVAIFCAPNLINWIMQALKKKDIDDLPVDTTNPSEWISHDLQVMGDKYDGIRILIYRQDTKAERLAQSYGKLDPALISRAKQEAEFFPNEVLTVVKKINVFCTNSYDSIMDGLISHLPVSNSSPQPQMQFPSGAPQ